MTLPLTSDTLAAAYDFLRATPPFNRWNMPAGENVVFKVIRSASLRGRYYFVPARRRHCIEVSSASIGHTHSLVEVMAHEMIHLHEEQVGAVTRAQHNAAYRKWAARVCAIHGFDPKLFW